MASILSFSQASIASIASILSFSFVICASSRLMSLRFSRIPTSTISVDSVAEIRAGTEAFGISFNANLPTPYR